MSKKTDELMTGLLGNRWKATHAPAAGVTLVLASPTPQNALERVNLETLWYSIRNNNAGVNFTVTLSLRNASAAGTVFASVDHLVAASTSANAAITNMQLAGEDGKAIAVTMDTVLASVTATVNIFGWTDSKNG